MAKYEQREYRCGDYWLSQYAKSPAWQRTWYDAATRQTKRASLGTTDFEQAKVALLDWVMANRQPQQEKPQEVLIADVLARYYEQHGKTLRTAKNTKAGLGYWLDHFGTASVNELTVPAQEAFHRELGKRMGAASVQRIVTMGKAALSRAYKRGELVSVPYVMPVKVGAAQPKGRPLEVEELQALYGKLPPHCQTLMLWLLGTAARPEAVLQLTSDQVDWKRRLVDLNTVGRTQTKKYRPMVRVPKSLGEFSGPLVVFRGKQVASVKTAWREAVAEAGLAGNVQLYSLRHTAARWMRLKGVPSEQVSQQLGHRREGTTGTYTGYAPDYLAKACKALDALVGAVQGKTVGLAKAA